MRPLSFVRVWAKNISLSREYFIFATIVVMAVTGATIAIGFVTYTTHIDKTNRTIQTDAIRINKLLEDTLNETNQIMVYIGKQIAKNGTKDLEFIANLLRNTSGTEYKTANFFSWSGFDWVSPNNLQLVNSKKGIAISPPNMAHREYTWKSPQHPWTLQVSRPAIGNPSNMWVIPAGTGITDSQDNFLGTLVIGLSVNEITSKIEHLIGVTSTKFIILDDNHNIIFQSTENSNNNEDHYYKQTSDEIFSNNAGELNQPISHNGISYAYYLKMNGYPYLILTGVDNNVFKQEIYSLLFPRIMEFLIGGVLGLILLFIFRQKIINPITELSNKAFDISRGHIDVFIPHQQSKELFNLAKGLIKVKSYIRRTTKLKKQLESSYLELTNKNKELEEIKDRLEQAAELAKSSDDAKEEFTRRIEEELNTPIDTIIYTCETLIKSQRGQIKVEISQEKQMELIENMYMSAKEIKTLTTHIIDIEPIDVKTVIDDCVTIHKKEALAKHIQLKANIPNNIPPFHADDLRFRQIIVGLLSRSIEYTPRGGNIEIDAETTTRKDKKRYLRLTVKDNGFGLSEEDIERLNNKFGKGAVSRKADGTELGLACIQKLVRLHKGSCKVDSQLAKGTVIIVTFPYLPENELEELQKLRSEDKASPSNVVRLF